MSSGNSITTNKQNESTKSNMKCAYTIRVFHCRTTNKIKYICSYYYYSLNRIIVVYLIRIPITHTQMQSTFFFLPSVNTFMAKFYIVVWSQWDKLGTQTSMFDSFQRFICLQYELKCDKYSVYFVNMSYNIRFSMP